MRITEVDNAVTQADIDQLEVFADRLFAKVGIDVEFTRHFLDRVNDERNIKQITMSELTRLFKQEYKRWGKPIAQLGPDAEAVMKDMATNINLPFALRWDHKNNELDLIAKTVMRKANFTTSNQEFAVEDGYRSMFRPSAYELAAERLHSVLQRKEKENGGVFRHALGWYASKIAGGFKNIDTRELIAYYQKNFDTVLSESDLPYITDESINESFDNPYEIEFVCVNPSFRDATDQKDQDALFNALKSVPGIIVYRQDFDVHNSMAAIIQDESNTDIPKKIQQLAKQHGVGIDLENDVSQDMIDDIVTGRLEGLIDYYDTTELRAKAFNEAKDGLPVKTLKGLFHVGTLDASKKRDGYEGAGLSVSTHPDAWKQIARGHVTGDTHSATKEGNKFLDAHSLSAAHNKQIKQWAVKNGYLEQQETVTVSWFDDEMDDTLSQTFNSMADAEAEHDEELEHMDVKVDKGGIVPTDKLKKETRQNRIESTGVLEFVLPIFAEQQGLDGVWWQDKLDVARYSAPRGVIVPSKINSWNFAVNESVNEATISSQQMLTKLSKEMQGTHTGVMDINSDWSKFVLSHKGFTLKDIQVDQIPTAVKSDGMSQANIEKYKKADTSQFPPMVIGNDGYLLDGNHRLQAYKAQGIKTVKAYIGENETVNEATEMKISDLTISDAGMAIAQSAGGGSRTDAPLSVTKLPSGHVYLVNGYHRLIDAMKSGKDTVAVKYVPYEKVEILWKQEREDDIKYGKQFNEEAVITEEAALKLDYDQLKIKIPANDNAKPKTGQVIDLNARRAAAKEALSKMSEAEKKAANEFIKKNKTLLQRLSAVGARSAARHGVATVSSAVTGPAAPVVATVLNVTLLGWDLVDAGIEVWKWARSSNSKDIGQGNANREFGNDFALEIPTYPTKWPMDRTGTVLKRKQSEWMKEFGNTHLRNGKLNPSAGYQDAIMKIAQANVDAKNKASDNELIKKEPEKELEKAPVINFTNIPPLEVPEFKPGKIEIPGKNTDTDIDTTLPKRVKEPKKGDPFTEPKTPIEPAPKGPKVVTTPPTQPKRTDKDPDNPEVPDSKPSDQPEIEIPQPLNAPQKDIPFIPPANLTDPEIAFQKDPVIVAPPVAGTGTQPPSNNNNNKKNKRKQKKDWGSGSDSDYNDPLQRWQRKYGMWDQ